MNTGATYPPITDDDADVMLPGQLRRSAFLDRAEREVREAVNEILRPAGQSTEGCPYLIVLFPRLYRRSAATLNAIVARYGGGISGADVLLATIVQRARRSAQAWLATGELQDVPELPLATGDRPPGEADLEAKPRDGEATPSPGDPTAVRTVLGAGNALEGAARGQMESAFGESFSDVRIHHDARADSLAQRYGALAFTVGNHIAFARGSFAPGTLAGDVLLAHELAHVRQQRGAGLAASDGELASEREADVAAAGVLGRRYGRLRSTQAVPPATRGGLALRRCKDKTPAPIKKDEKVLSQGTMRWSFTPSEKDSRVLDVRIEFIPNEALKKTAKSITFLQTVIATGPGGAPNLQDFGGGQAFAGPENVRVDFLATKNLDPLYGDPWKPSKPDEPAVLTDMPITMGRKEFETVALVPETGQVLGSLHWGVQWGSDGSGSSGLRLFGAEQTDCQEVASPKFQPAVERFFENRFEETLDGFAPNGAELSDDHRKALDRIASALRADPKKIALVAATGDLSEKDPDRISASRADAVRDYLVRAGIDGSRVRSHAFGAGWARVPTKSGAGDPRNRRVHVVLADLDTSEEFKAIGGFRMLLPARGQ